MAARKEAKRQEDWGLAPVEKKETKVPIECAKGPVLSKWEKEESLPGHDRNCQLESVDVEGKAIVVAKGKFKLKSQKVLLTYRGHLDKEKTIAHFKKQFPKMLECSDHFIRCAHETGKTTGVDYPHTHVLINFGYQIQKESFDWCMLDGIPHPNIRCCGTMQHYKNAMRYLSKEDPANADLVVAMPTLREKMEGKTVSQALDMCTRFSDVSGALMMQSLCVRPRYDPFNDPVLKREPNGFQKLVISVIDSPADDRGLVWYYNEKGGAGKTILIKHLFASRPESVLAMSGAGCEKDFSHAIISAFDKGWNGSVFLLNVVRDQQGFDGSLYKSLEKVKDGLVSSQKYQGGTVSWKPGHVIVMANWLPRINSMSIDRWHIWNVVNTPELTTVSRMDPHEILAKQVMPKIDLSKVFLR